MLKCVIYSDHKGMNGVLEALLLHLYGQNDLVRGFFFIAVRKNKKPPAQFHIYSCRY